MKTGQKIYFNDSRLVLGPAESEGKPAKRNSEVNIRLYLDYVDPMLQLQGPGSQDIVTETTVIAATALFGGDPTAVTSSGHPALRFGHGEGVRVLRIPSNPLGCTPYSEAFPDNEAVAVQRGECTFLEKLVLAQQAGASGVVVLGDEEQHINPSAEKAELDEAGPQINNAAIVVLRRADAALVAQMLDAAEVHGLGTVRLIVEPWHDDGPAGAEKTPPQDGHTGEQAKKSVAKDPTRVLYLNNHPLLNTRLLV